VKQLSCWPLT
jgi:hypothetical protein